MPKAVHGLTMSTAPATTRRDLLSKIPALAAGAALVGSIPTGALAGPRSWSPEFLKVMEAWDRYSDPGLEEEDLNRRCVVTHQMAIDFIQRPVTSLADFIEVFQVVLVFMGDDQEDGYISSLNLGNEYFEDALLEAFRTMARKEGFVSAGKVRCTNV